MRPLTIGAGLATGAVVLALGAGVAFALMTDRQPDDNGSAGQDSLREEIQAMTDAGLPEDDPKVALLEEELAEFEALAETAAEPDPGFDPAALDELVTGSTRSMQPDSTEEWDDGEVECEPVPGKLTVDDIAEATCFVEQQSDGSVRYVAVAPDGTEREARFAEE